MSLSEPISPAVWSLLAVMARVGGFAAFVPTLTTQPSALKFRLALAIVLVALILPAAPVSIATRAQAPDALACVISELAVGLLFAFALRAVFMGIALATQLVEQQLGLLAAVEESDDAPTTPFGRVYHLTALAVFLTLGGHRLVVEGLLKLSAENVMAAVNGPKMIEGTVMLLGQACWLSVRVAAPILLALLAISLSAAMMTRVFPQFAGSAITLPAQTLLGLLLVLCSLSVASSTFADGFARVTDLVARMFVDGG